MASQSQKTTRPKMTLYQCPMYRSFRCLWLIHELGVQDDVRLVKLDSINGKDSEEYKEYKRSVNPHGTIPALVIEGEEEPIIESTAICLYLADYYGNLVPPVDKRKEYYDWSVYAAVTMEEIIEFVYWQWVVPNKRCPPDPEGVKKMEAKYDICMKRLTKALQGKKYICGDSLTAVDCILGYNVWAANDDMFNKGSLVKDYPEVKAYVKRLEERQAFKDTLTAQSQ